MLLAIINGIVTSIILETIILLKRMRLVYAFKTALGMSLISMLIMETIMNMVDIVMMGGAFLSIEVIPIILISGWIAAAPYNYYRINPYPDVESNLLGYHLQCKKPPSDEDFHHTLNHFF